jgi:hypothetical protein
VTSMRVIRWILVGLTAVLAALLVVRGNVVVGVVLGAIAITRAMLLARLQHRRSMFRQTIASRRDSTWRRTASRPF